MYGSIILCARKMKKDCEIARLENEKTFRSYLNPIFKGCYRQELLRYMEEKDCMPVIKDGDMERIHQPLDLDRKSVV